MATKAHFNSRGSLPVAVIMLVLIATVTSLLAIEGVSMTNFHTNERAKADFHNMLTQASLLLSRPDICPLVFKDMRMSDVVAISMQSLSAMTSLQKAAFAYDRTLNHEDHVVLAGLSITSNLQPLWPDKLSFFGDIHFVVNRVGTIQNTKLATVPVYFALDAPWPAGKVNRCHATAYADSVNTSNPKIPIEEFICASASPPGKYNPATDLCH